MLLESFNITSSVASSCGSKVVGMICVLNGAARNLPVAERGQKRTGVAFVVG